MRDEKKEAVRMARFWLRKCRALGVNVNGVNAQEKQEEKEKLPPAPPKENKEEPKESPLLRAHAHEEREAQELFDAFWAAYPSGHKVAKKKCRDKITARYKNAKDKAAFINALLDSLDNWKHTERWMSGFICNPETFINQERWLDEPPPDIPQAAKPRRGVSQTANVHSKEVGKW